MTFESLPKLRAATSLGFTRHLPSPNLGPDSKTRRDGELLFEALTGVVPGEVRADSPDPFLTPGKRGRGSPKDGTRTGFGHPRAAFSEAHEIQDGRASKLGAGKGLVNSSPITSPVGVRTVEIESDGWDVLVKGRDGKRQPAMSATGIADQAIGNGASEVATRSDTEGDVTRAAEPPPVADVISKPASPGGAGDSRKRPSGSPPTGGRKRSSGRARARPAADAGVQTEVSETEEESDDGFVFGSYESFFYQASTLSLFCFCFGAGRDAWQVCDGD
jgi:hypothetical protein